MTQSGARPTGDEADKRAPSQDAWAKLTPEERARIALALPAFIPIELASTEGDAHRKAKHGAVQALESFYRRIKRRMYVSSDLAVYYPGEARIVPDLFVVVDAEPSDRMKWVVTAEGKGVDFMLEVRHPGQQGGPGEGDLERALTRYAALGISEYFLVDRERRRLRGFRLPSRDARAYAAISPEEGRLPSRVLGLDLAVEGAKLRFSCGTAVLPEADEIIVRLAAMLNEAVVLKEEAERRADEEARRAEEALQRAEAAARRVAEVLARTEDEGRRAEELAERTAHTERRLAEALSELHKLKGWE
jgi:Uma2 family endonuclease